MSELDKEVVGKAGVTTEEVDNRIAKAVDSLKAKHGSADVALFKLVDENYGYRDQIRDLKAKAPSEGAIILTGDDAKAWGAYRELGAVADVRKAVSERDQLKAKGEEYEREKLHARAAKALGCVPDEEFHLLVKDLPIEVIAEQDKDGKAVDSARVKGATESDKPIPLAEYLKANRPKLFEALKAEEPRPRGTPSAFGPSEQRPRPSKADDPYADLPYEHAPPAM